jgi:hypothetical protein
LSSQSRTRRYGRSQATRLIGQIEPLSGEDRTRVVQLLASHMGIVKEAEFEVREACIFALGRLHTVLSKYGDHLPLYRQEDIAARYGVVLRRSTLCDWIAAAADLAEPLY